MSHSIRVDRQNSYFVRVIGEFLKRGGGLVYQRLMSESGHSETNSYPYEMSALVGKQTFALPTKESVVG